ncbi:MAG: alpha/beta fold hydrolase [Bacteroidota bacterium]
MKRIKILLLSACCLGLGFGNLLGQDTPEGDWYGNLDVGPMQLRITFHIQKTEDGYTSSLDSPDQGAMDIPVDETTFDAPNLTLKLAKLKATYKGELNEAGDQLTGTFTQNGQNMPLTMTTAKPDGPARPQTPVPPFAYESTDVMFYNADADINLAGTFTAPKGKGTYPAVILITGSGPQDRDETLFEHKPFAVIADHLTQKGIAVLRFDDRGVGDSEGNHREATSADFATDVMAGIDWLAKQENVKADQIGMVGHSEGGLIAQIVASQSDKAAFMIQLAGPGLGGDEILTLQTGLIFTTMGMPEATVTKWNTIQRDIFGIIKSTENNAQVQILVEAKADEWEEMLDMQDKTLLQYEREKVIKDLPNMTSTWMRYFLKTKPEDMLVKIQIPHLALFGEKDLQVPAKENLAAMETTQASNGQFQSHIFPSLNHLFQKANTGLVMEYGKIETTVEPEVLDYMSNWIKETL